MALSKYRVAAVVTPHSPHLWNNIGMCFYGKGKFVAAIACLKRAQYLDPFEWIVSYNLGLLHLASEQYASAFHYLSASVNLSKDVAAPVQLLAVALARLGDVANATAAYAQAAKLDPSSPITRLNWAVSLYNHGQDAEAAKQLAEFDALWSALTPEEQGDEPTAPSTRAELAAALQAVSAPPPAPSAPAEGKA